MSTARIREFQKTVWAHYRKSRRDLPWRPDARLRASGRGRVVTPYRVLVSEIMLQQTPVDRVVPKYCEFLKAFPTVCALAKAPLSEVLRVWQGLGYNRRAKHLRQTAEIILSQNRGVVPQAPEALAALPGIGRNTAGAIAAFAFNEPVVFIETNIRTVFLRRFFPRAKNVPDTKLLPLIEKTLDSKHPCEWYSALMDYGTHLKQAYPNPSRASAHHTRQSRFEGSDRQIRGLIVHALLERGPLTEAALVKAVQKKPQRVKTQCVALQRDGLIFKKGRTYALP